MPNVKTILGRMFQTHPLNLGGNLKNKAQNHEKTKLMKHLPKGHAKMTRFVAERGGLGPTYQKTVDGAGEGFKDTQGPGLIPHFWTQSTLPNGLKPVSLSNRDTN